MKSQTKLATKIRVWLEIQKAGVRDGFDIARQCLPFGPKQTEIRRNEFRDELIAERAELAGIVDEQAALLGRERRLRESAEEKADELRVLNSMLVAEKTRLMAHNADLMARLDSLSPDQVQAVMHRAAAIRTQNARLDELSGLLTKTLKARGGALLN